MPLTLWEIEDLTGHNSRGTQSYAVNDNGQAVGAAYTSASAYDAMSWTPAGGTVSLNTGLTGAVACAVTPGGYYILGTTPDIFIWSASGLVNLGLSGATNQGGISEDGSTIAAADTTGTGAPDPANALLFDQSSSYTVYLGTIVPGGNSVATGISQGGIIPGNVWGVVICGYSQDPLSNFTKGFIALLDEYDDLLSITDIGLPPGFVAAHANITPLAISADGSTIVGYCDDATHPQQAFLWTQASGFTLLGTLPGHTTSSAWGVSGDGSIVVGRVEPNDEAFIWTAAGGMQLLNTYAAAGGVVMAGIDLFWATGISPNGYFITGMATFPDTPNAGFYENGFVLGPAPACQLCLSPVNVEPYGGFPWGPNGSYGGLHSIGSNLYALASPNPAVPDYDWNVYPNGYAQIWKSTDGGKTWTMLATESALTAAEWNLQWAYYWHTSNEITFVMELTGNLVNFNLATETWSAPYATNWGGPSSGQTRVVNTAQLTRLSDGRVMMFYRQLGASNGQMCWAVANSGGSGAWDSKDHVAYIPVLGQGSVDNEGPANPVNTCVDPADRSHVVFVCVSSNGEFQVHYLNVDSTGVVSAPFLFFYSGGASPTNIIAVNGKLYFGDTKVAVQMWIGDNLVAPNWTNYLVRGHDIYDDYLPGAGFLMAEASGAIVFFWNRNWNVYDFLTNKYNIWADIVFSEFLAGEWTPAQIFLDFRITQPQPPLVPHQYLIDGTPVNTGLPWSLLGFTLENVVSGPYGWGMAVDLKTYWPYVDQTTGYTYTHEAWLVYAVICCGPTLCLFPVNDEEYAGWQNVGGTLAYSGPYLLNGNLYALTQLWTNASGGTNGSVNRGYAEIWKSTDKGRTWVRLPLEPSLTTDWYNSFWTYYWTEKTTKITFFLNWSGKLVDYDIATETWSAPYGLNWGPPPPSMGGPGHAVLGNGQPVRLSDGRVLLFYTGRNPAVNAVPCWAVANTAGDGVWDSIDTPTPNGHGGNIDSWCVDPTDRSHLIDSQQYYFNVTPAYVFSPGVQMVNPNWIGTWGNLIAAPDGKLYWPASLNLDTTRHNTIDIYISDSYNPTVWTHEVIFDYGPYPGPGFGGIPSASFLFIAWINGQAMVFWDEYTYESHNVTKYSELVNGAWTWPAVYIDLWTSFPSPPITSSDNWWYSQGFSVSPVPFAPEGAGVLLAILATYAPSDPSNALMLFFLAPCIPPPTLKNYLAMQNALVAKVPYIV